MADLNTSFDPSNYPSDPAASQSDASGVASSAMPSLLPPSLQSPDTAAKPAFNPADYNSGAIQPAYIDGTTPGTAINKSPLDFTDRLKLAMGNEKGRGRI